MPHEILSMVMQEFCGRQGRASLASLALVNSDCLQLARSCQWSSIRLVRCDNSESLLQFLLRKSGGNENIGSIGPCVRQLCYDGDFGRLKKDSTTLYPVDSSRQACLALLENVSRLFPNLETFIWIDRNFSPNPSTALTTMCKPLVSSNIKRAILNLKSGVFLEDFDMSLESTSSLPMLQTLYLADETLAELCLTPASSKELQQRSTLSKLLHYCAPSLLELHVHAQRDLYTIFENCGRSTSLEDREKNVPRFQKLQVVAIPDIFSDAASWIALLSAPLNHMALLYPGPKHPRKDSVLEDSLAKRGRIRSLESLHWSPQLSANNILPTDKFVRFLKSNDHISRFVAIRPSLPAAAIDMILPTLESFGALTTLCLCWNTSQKYLPASAIDQIGKITSLEMLLLGTCIEEVDVPLACKWTRFFEGFAIDHHAIRISLRNLGRLRKLAFWNDTYVWHAERPADMYYKSRRFGEDGTENTAETKKAFDENHYKRMRGEADKYTACFFEIMFPSHWAT
ncbi:hypothetical protein HYFRA_00013129 [Hymenoscyphus fraxineus]|uniref:Uncharacterized protein n=1 Tax=Hymenoscyphus fraxineus TaxID=746836 RepID=A0A9N9PZM0_9HELO|nr:hypothetical protein HYFRA_00013129 [Hymenoscyphus fraxineus]